jgi:hypothetical protein
MSKQSKSLAFYGTNGCLAGAAYVIIISEILEDVRVLSRGVVAALTIKAEVLEENTV